jgi:hypothetical protein
MPVIRRAGLAARARGLLSELSAGDAPERLAVAVARAEAGDGAALDREVDAALAALDDLEGEPLCSLVAELAPAAARRGAEEAVEVAERILDQLPRVTDSLNTNSHFCLSVLRVVESAARCVAREDLMLDDFGRWFLEEDEHLLRRRMRADLERLAEAR